MKNAWRPLNSKKLIYYYYNFFFITQKHKNKTTKFKMNHKNTKLFKTKNKQINNQTEGTKTEKNIFF